MKGMMVVLFGGLIFAAAACGSNGSQPSIEPLGGDDIATSLDGDSIATVDRPRREPPDTPSSDGCGGTCGSCGTGMNCLDGQCAMGCDSANCGLGVGCVFADGTPALCGGSISFDTNLQGEKLNDNLNVETLFANAGVYFYTPSDNAVVATNHWELDSNSGKNSCASFDKNGQAWREPVYIRFAKPAGESAFQAATHYVSLFIGDSWPGGIAVDFYAPGPSPGSPGVEAFHSELTTGNGTSFIEFGSGSPIGYVVVHKADDPDFTIDDLTFGPLYVP